MWSISARKGAHVAAAIVFVGAVSSHLLVLFLMAAGLLGYEDLLPFRPLKGPVSSAIAGLLLHVSLVVMVAAQHRMGASWRIGIDDQSETKLVSGGIFRYSRNPIYLGFASPSSPFSSSCPVLSRLSSCYAAKYPSSTRQGWKRDILPADSARLIRSTA